MLTIEFLKPGVAEYNQRDILSNINPLDEICRSIEWFLNYIGKLLIIGCKNKYNLRILLKDAVDLNYNLACKITFEKRRTKDAFEIRDFSSTFSF